MNRIPGFTAEDSLYETEDYDMGSRLEQQTQARSAQLLDALDVSS
ncbi:MAG: hypothetical protein ACREYC_20480 [Gammaproteobacteria bacterium]